jgi:nicotinate-nucleotide adenylyltransferase
MLDPQRCRTLLIYGGAFDPPHRGHVELPPRAAEQIHAHGVLYVPTGEPPHKSPTAAPAEHRLAMLRLALGDRSDCAISTWEIEHAGPSYTVRTLEHLRQELPGVELRLLIGADMAASFYGKWKDPRRIIELAEPVVMLRPPYGDPEAMLTALPDDLPEPERRAWRDRLVTLPTIEAASTDLRRALAAGRYDDPAVRERLPSAVLDYIRQHRLSESPEHAGA